jgi:hypothetical protein
MAAEDGNNRMINRWLVLWGGSFLGPFKNIPQEAEDGCTAKYIRAYTGELVSRFRFSSVDVRVS